MSRPVRRRWRVGVLAATACAVCCVVELAVLGAFGTLTVGAVFAEATELLPLLLVALAAAAVLLTLRRRRRQARRPPPPPVSVPMPTSRPTGEDTPIQQQPGTIQHRLTPSGSHSVSLHGKRAGA